MNFEIGRVPDLKRSKSGLRALFGWVLLCGVFASACAKVGDPLPPVPQPPPTTQSLKVETVGGRALLLFRLPAEDVQWVEIHRQCDLRNPVDRLELLARISWTELRESGEAGVFSWEDRAAGSVNCRYALRFVNERGLRSEFSNLATPAMPAMPRR